MTNAAIKVVQVMAYDHANGSVIASFEKIEEAREYACKVGNNPAYQNLLVQCFYEDGDMKRIGQFFGGQWFDSPDN